MLQQRVESYVDVVSRGPDFPLPLQYAQEGHDKEEANLSVNRSTAVLVISALLIIIILLVMLLLWLASGPSQKQEVTREETTQEAPKDQQKEKEKEKEKDQQKEQEETK
jgi:flagellar basal body-associated protein FliL